MAEPLALSDYDERWVAEFEELRDRVLDALRGVTARVEHVGSTAVPGLVAKPVIDLDVVVATRDDVPVAVERLASLGYEAGARSGGVTDVEGLVALGWPKGERRHHVYVVIADSLVHRRRLVFRDFLRSHPEEWQRYVAVKDRAARDSGGDWERYAQAKQAYVEDVLRIAVAEASPRRVVRRARVEDSEAIAEVHVASWRAAYRGIIDQAVLDGLDVAERAQAHRRHLADPRAERRLHVCEDDGCVVAFATCGPAATETSPAVGEVHALYAHPDAWNSGAGRALIAVVLDDLRGAGNERALVHVLDANGRARRFYERAGFAVEATGLPLGQFPFALTQARYGRSL